MPKFAANLTMLFNEVPFLERFAAAAQAGFTAVEFLFPYPYPAADLAERLAANRLRLVLHNLPAGNWEAGVASPACPIASPSSATVSGVRSNTPRRSACLN